MVWVNGCGCQRAYSYRHCAADAEMPIAFRSPRPSRRMALSVSVLTSRIAGYATRMSGGVGGALSDGRPYPYGHSRGFIAMHVELWGSNNFLPGKKGDFEKN